MSYRTDKSFAARMDDLAALTGIPRLTSRLAQDRQHRRPLRWPSMVALVLATIGFGLTLAMPGRFFPGVAMLLVVDGIALFLTWSGPVKPWGTTRGVDERDRALRRDAYFATMTGTTTVAVLGLIAIAGLALLGRWDRLILVVEIGMLAFYLVLLCLIVPTLYVSWTTRPIEDE